MAIRTTGRDSYQFMLRLPDEVRDRLRERARENMRTLNAEINFIIAKALEAEADREKAA